MITQLEPLSKQDKIKLSNNEVCQRLRKQLKADFPNLKISLSKKEYSGGWSMQLIILESKETRFLKRFDELSELAIFKYTTETRRTLEELKQMFERTHFQGAEINEHEKYNPDSWINGVFLTEKGFDILKSITKAVNHYNWDESNSMIDYFDVKFYLHMGLGSWIKPFKDGVN